MDNLRSPGYNRLGIRHLHSHIRLRIERATSVGYYHLYESREVGLWEVLACSFGCERGFAAFTTFLVFWGGFCGG